MRLNTHYKSISDRQAFGRTCEVNVWEMGQMTTNCFETLEIFFLELFLNFVGGFTIIWLLEVGQMWGSVSMSEHFCLACIGSRPKWFLVALKLWETSLKLVIDHQGRFHHDFNFKGGSKWVPAYHVWPTLYWTALGCLLLQMAFNCFKILGKHFWNLFLDFKGDFILIGTLEIGQSWTKLLIFDSLT